MPDGVNPKLSRELLGLAGEYAVASELCRRNIYAQLTMGNHKQTDILVETETVMMRIQVEAKQSTEWPAISGLYRAEDFLILVDFAEKSSAERPEKLSDKGPENGLLPHAPSATPVRTREDNERCGETATLPPSRHPLSDSF